MDITITALDFFITILTGVIVVLIGNFFLQIYIKPLDSALKIISKTKKYLNYYARQITSPGVMKEEKINEASESLRDVASEILVLTATVRGYNLFKFLKLLPKKKSLEKAYDELIGLSNSLYEKNLAKQNWERMKKIAKLLS